MYEAVENKDPHHLANDFYYPCSIYKDGKKTPALFTKNQINRAIQRAERNPEDFPEKNSLWRKIFKK
jgi:hypothetical protein